MIVSVVLNTEYMPVAERNKWFLKSVSNAINDDTLIVTHEYMKNHLQEIVEGCEERFYKEFEMQHVSVEKINRLDICYIPDNLFEEIYNRNGKSQTKFLLECFNKRNEKIERVIKEYIDRALKKRNIKKPDYILNSLHVFASIKYISELYKCPIVPYVFSAIRKVHGYTQTLYMAHIDKNLFNSNAAELLYEEFEREDKNFKFFNKKEILALLGKKHNLPLIPLVNSEKSKYEVGVAGEGFHLIPETYQSDCSTDDDIYYECKRNYNSDKITTRLHPLQLDQAGIGRKHLKNDPLSFLLSCKRIVTVQSQMIIKAAMWNRSACTYSNGLPYHFLLNKNITDTNKISDIDLNFILFAYFVPDKCMFDKKYWLWRINNKPKVIDLMKKHLTVMFGDLGLNENITESPNRLTDILKQRGCTEYEIKEILQNNIDNVSLAYPSSKMLVTFDDNSTIEQFCMNRETDERIRSYFYYESSKNIKRIDLSLLNDVDGFISVDRIILNNNEQIVDIKDEYSPKNKYNHSFDINKKTKSIKLEAYWTAKSFNEQPN